MASMPSNLPALRALILYGNGAELGDFKLFADDLVSTDLSKRFNKENILINKTILRDEVFQAILDQPDGSVMELHIFSHSIGGGLYTGYHDHRTEMARSNMLDAANAFRRKISYMEVLQAELGAVLTDHLIVLPFCKDQAKMKAKFAGGATGKLWGCNAGVSNWVYSDSLGDRLVVAEDEKADYYYWRALNTKNTPKPSVAQGLADFWGIRMQGASSGAHVEVFHQKHWITSGQYKAEKKHWPGAAQILRLAPDVGKYADYVPSN